MFKVHNHWTRTDLQKSAAPQPLEQSTSAETPQTSALWWRDVGAADR
ncbi:MAG: hypothetical protein OSB72_05640 [Gammaproteobacteria bacterium]|nr:hypothetical protein [Gammaproteobacteria bacterium]